MEKIIVNLSLQITNFKFEMLNVNFTILCVSVPQWFIKTKFQLKYETQIPI